MFWRISMSSFSMLTLTSSKLSKLLSIPWRLRPLKRPVLWKFNSSSSSTWLWYFPLFYVSQIFLSFGSHVPRRFSSFKWIWGGKLLSISTSAPSSISPWHSLHWSLITMLAWWYFPKLYWGIGGIQTILSSMSSHRNPGWQTKNVEKFPYPNLLRWSPKTRDWATVTFSLDAIKKLA